MKKARATRQIAALSMKPLADSVLRDMGYVLHLTESLKRTILADRAQVAIAVN
jgi:hypothetical protein